jgi:site-specific DNA recombinase
MRCAIYARRSTEEHQVASLNVQIEEAERYIASKGWTVATGHIYLDDAVSRAEFKKRPGLIALLNALASAEFDAIVLRDDTRLGGDMHRTGLVVQDMVESGKRLFCYFEGNEITLDGATDKIMMALRGFAAELEREKIAGRTREHLETKARRGLNTGGRCYGYDNVPIYDGSQRTHVDYRINEGEATIVREVFDARAAGDGYRTIAKRLNSRRVPSPKAGRRGSGSWAPTMIREMLLRERYIGSLVWGKAAKAYRGGTKVRLETAPEGRIRTERPELRIVPQALWEQVAETMRPRETPWKAGALGRAPKHLLSGLGRCAECGGSMLVMSAKHGTETVKLYGCSHNHNRGEAVCKNTLKRPMLGVDAALIEWLQVNVLSEEVIEGALTEVRQRLAARREQPHSERDDLEVEARRLRGEIDRLVAALADGVESPTIAGVIGEREKRLAEVQARLGVIAVAPSVLNLEVRRLEKEARARLADFQGLLGRNVAESRTTLEALLTGPLRFEPVQTKDGRRYQISGAAAVGLLCTTDCVPKGIRTPVTALKGPCPGPG